MNINKSTQDMKRVWKVTKKPTKQEYFQTLKIVLIGFLFIGIVGFLMEIIWLLVLSKLFIVN